MQNPLILRQWPSVHFPASPRRRWVAVAAVEGVVVVDEGHGLGVVLQVEHDRADVVEAVAVHHVLDVVAQAEMICVVVKVIENLAVVRVVRPVFRHRVFLHTHAKL